MQVVREASGEVLWMLDEAAAGDLSPDTAVEHFV